MLIAPPLLYTAYNGSWWIKYRLSRHKAFILTVLDLFKGYINLTLNNVCTLQLCSIHATLWPYITSLWFKVRKTGLPSFIVKKHSHIYFYRAQYKKKYIFLEGSLEEGRSVCSKDDNALTFIKKRKHVLLLCFSTTNTHKFHTEGSCSFRYICHKTTTYSQLFGTSFNALIMMGTQISYGFSWKLSSSRQKWQNLEKCVKFDFDKS